MPRPLRLVLTASGAASCLIATVITGTQLLAVSLLSPCLAAGARLCTGSQQSPVSSPLSALPDASQDLKYGGAGANAPTVAINAAGCLLFAALFLADQRAADMRITRRDAV